MRKLIDITILVLLAATIVLPAIAEMYNSLFGGKQGDIKDARGPREED